ncbi:MAG: DEAD/DEAH box helicase [Patescibacteria group bacterium]
MNRLLQGDVGSGKTIVAAAVILVAAKNGYQSVLMVPTEILAQQHYQNLKTLLTPLGISVKLITGSNKKEVKDSKEIWQLIVGTHALLHRRRDFRRIGLVIIDEQHRFGVSQRSILIEKSNLPDKDRFSPHILTMTATPIPRTITLTVYGDLDVSSLDQMPPGRKPVKTYLVPGKKRKDCYQWIKKQIKTGQSQAFIICPLVEDSETLESVKSATEEYRKLKKEVFSAEKIGLIHGRMKSKEKEAVLAKMKNGETEILVATPVVEVGIDIAGANIMIIEAANRFGLAQLHQLRGRVGRGKKQAYCFLFAGKTGLKAKKRLRAMEENKNGLKLAEIDLKIRGPGEIYGTQQHGFPEFKIASYTDLALIRSARFHASQVLEKSPTLALYPKIKQKLNRSPGKIVAPN